MANEGLNIISESDLQAPLKLTDNYKELEKTLNDIIKTGGAESTLIASTKSIKELGTATTQLQDKNKKLVDAQKKVTTEMKKTETASHDHHDALHLLDEKTGHYIGTLKKFGAQLATLAKSPFILALGIIIGLLAAATSAVKTFFHHTSEGEDIAREQGAVWKQFFNVLANGWSKLGKSVTDLFKGKDGGMESFINAIFVAAQVAFPFMAGWLAKMQAEFNKTSAEARELAKRMIALDTLTDEHLVESAKNQAEINRISFEALDKTTKEKIKLLEEEIAVKERQNAADVVIAKAKLENLTREIGLVHGLTIAEVKAMDAAHKRAKFNSEENKALAEATAELVKVQGEKEQTIKKNEKARLKLVEEARKEDVKLAMDAAAKEVDIAKAAVEEKISVVKKEIRDGNIDREKGEQQILDIKRAYANQIIQIEINTLDKILGLNLLNAEERAEVEKKLAQLKIDLLDAEVNQTTQLKEGTVESYESMLATITGIYNDFTDSLGALFDTFTENRLAEIDRIEERQEAYYDNLIRMAGDNEARKSEIENEADRKRQELERKRIQLLRRAAIFEKITSGTQAAINTALAVTNQLAGGDPYTAFARALAAGIAGGIQVAAIAAKQLPQYELGGTTTQRRIIAGEAGSEFYRTPSGRTGFTPNVASVMDLPSGTRIWSNEDTMRMLAAGQIAGMDVGGTRGNRSDLSRALISKLDSVESAIKNKRETHYNWTRKGLEKAFKNGNARTYFMDNFYR